MRSAFYNLINFINTAKVDDVYANAAKKILENINKIPELNITDVAEMCFVSTATISRLCRKLNYESFSDFKMDVTMNLRYFNHDSMRMQFDHQLPVLPVAGKTTKDLFNDHFENIVQNLRSTYEMIEFEELEKLVDLIYQSNEICFAGNFFTQSVSMQLQLVLYAISQNKDLDELSLEEFKNISDVFEEDVYQAIDVNTCVNKRNTIGACGQDMMKKVIALNEEYLKQF